MQLALILATFIALPVGRGANRNDGNFIFVEVQNLTTWPTGWAFMLSWLSPICTRCRRALLSPNPWLTMNVRDHWSLRFVCTFDVI
jgi:hypothetical protein